MELAKQQHFKTKPFVTAKTLHINLLDILTTAVVVLDENLHLFHINPSAEILLETSGKRSQNTYIGDVILNSEEILPAIENVKKNGHTFIARKVDLHLHSHDIVIVDYSISSIEDIGNDYLLLEIQSHDRAWEINRKETLLSTHKATSELVRGLGHEIKNPLGGIRGAAQLLALELDNKELQDYTNIIIEETDRLVNLIDRLTGNYIKPEISMINIHEVTERVCALLEAECKGSIKIRRDYDPSIPELEGDSEQLIQAILNIARNAMQALNEAEGITNPEIILKTRTASHVTIGAQHFKLAAIIKITDNGPGIDPEILDTIFYPLISGRAEGTGLGLSIAQTIVKNHEGLIECDSRKGNTTFTVSIPIEEGRAP